jgi:serine/threonine-protein kinase
VTWASDGYLYRTASANGAFVIGRSEPKIDAPIEVVTSLDTAKERSHQQAALLPDRKTLLFQIELRSGKRMIAVGDIATRRHTILMEGARARYAESGHLLYTTSDGKLWAVPFDVKKRTTSGIAIQVADRIPSSIVGPIDFAVSETGTLVYSVEDAGARRELTWVTRAGKREPVDSSWKGDFSSPALSFDGSHIAVAMQEAGQTAIWIKPVSGGNPTKLMMERRNLIEPAWSPDGQWVTFLATLGVSSTGDVWRQRTDGSGRAERVVQSPRPISEQLFARDGTLLVRTTTPTPGAGDILKIRPGVDSAPIPLLATPAIEYSPVVSPDGKWLAYVSNESGRLEVYVAPFDSPGASKWAVSTNGGTSPRWSHRGDELFYLDLQSNLMSVRVTTTPSFAAQGARLLFNASDFIQTAFSRRNYDVSADDQRFLMVQRADGVKRGQVIVVEHWLDELRRKEQRP